MFKEKSIQACHKVSFHKSEYMHLMIQSETTTNVQNENQGMMSSSDN